MQKRLNQSLLAALIAIPALFLLGAIASGQKSDTNIPVMDNPPEEIKNAEKLTDEEWRDRLSSEQYRILRNAGTERAFGDVYKEFKAQGDGDYYCAGCGAHLFSSEHKFDSHCGWPSFYDPAKIDSVETREDISHGMARIEVVCANCKGHLGHRFDGEGFGTPTDQRYCINGGVLVYVPKGEKPPVASSSSDTEIATLGGGCFWCVEALYEMIPGVVDVRSGYSGGHVENPTYEQVCGKKTGHAEVVQIEFDPSMLSYSELLDHFWDFHDPTTLNRQGADVGPQYRSIILYHNEQQKEVAEQSTAKAASNFKNPIVTELTEFEKFYEAENYHQDFYRLNKTYPYCSAVITPKVKKLEKKQAAKN